MKHTKSARNKIQSRYGLLFMLPGFLGFVLFVFIPLLFTVYYSLFDNSGSFAPLSNITSLFRSRSFIIALRNTSLYMAAGGGLAIVLSFTLAWILFNLIKGNVRGTSAVKLGCLMPMVVPTGVSVLFAQLLFSFDGVVNTIFGTQTDWLTTQPYSFWIMVLLYIWKNFGYNMIIFLVAFHSIEPSIYETARCEGSGTLRMLIRIVIPQIMPSTFFVVIMSIVGVFKMNRESYLLFGDYPNESAYMFQNFINNNLSKLEYNRAACSAIVLLVIFSILVYLMINRSERTD